MSIFKGKILLAEDDIKQATLLAETLLERGYDTTTYDNGLEAFSCFQRNADNIDLCLFDVRMQGLDGLTLTSRIRIQNERVPILLISALTSENDVCKGLMCGANDYVRKPLNLLEIELRIELWLRRTKKLIADTRDVIELADWKLDAKQMALIPPGKARPISLSDRKFVLMEYLARRQNKFISRSELLLSIWGVDDYFAGRSMDVFISHLRKYFKNQRKVNLNYDPTEGYMLKVKT
ncbi:response regulator transcription factor [Chitinophaga horti]|uniref:Response regulator transcription factor n=1 Tax=Chitinophaga horti TaxID=2920382 RepID=A0ABY6J0J6_9BACT|nr:response regulator transcription factor [Chitinophaga horti]UYQ92167.1 response regulator transcription factor [Chitinophaga horti]